MVEINWKEKYEKLKTALFDMIYDYMEEFDDFKEDLAVILMESGCPCDGDCVGSYVENMEPMRNEGHD